MAAVKPTTGSAAMNNDTIRLRLYLAGQSPNSTRAVANLERLLAGFSENRPQTELVDVFEARERALADRVLMTPMLLVETPGNVHRFVGDLAEPEGLSQLLSRFLTRADA